MNNSSLTNAIAAAKSAACHYIKHILPVLAFLAADTASGVSGADKNPGGMLRTPLRVSENGRYLVDASAKPVLLVGDTAWSLLVQLNEANIARYLEDRQGRGFNAIIVNLLEHKYASKAPAKIDGVEPFLKPGDFSQPNPVYFDYAHRVIEAAGQRGIIVWLCPAYLGWGGGDEGFFKEIKTAGPSVLRGYGRFLGGRFKDLNNIVWMMGGDYALPEAERWVGNELAEGLRAGGAAQLMTAHGGQTTAIDTYGNQPWLAVDTVYRYQPDLWRPLLENYLKKPIRPFVLIETTYEGEHNAAPAEIRRLAWWSMMSGACGQFFGNNPLWHFDGPGLFKTDITWQQALDSTGSRDIARLGVFLSKQPWFRLVPDIDGKRVQSEGVGVTAKVVSAIASDNTFAMAYIPADGRSPRELTLNLAAFPAPVAAHWFNPAKDTALIAHPTIIPNRDRQTFHTPGDNGTGTNDWVLVLETTQAKSGFLTDAPPTAAVLEPSIPEWSRFEHEFKSASKYTNALQQTDMRVEFRSPSGVMRTAYGFWDGGDDWKMRFAPDEKGVWTWRSFASDTNNSGLHHVIGSFVCEAPRAQGTRFERHGPVIIANDGVHLTHADGTPFFWLADTAWSGPLWSSAEDWEFYIEHRVAQGFTAVQWVAGQWRGAPEGDALKRRAYQGEDCISINLDFFRRIEQRHESLARAGLLSVPVMMWAINRGPEDAVNPGVSLPEKEAILLGRYMAARWNADPVVWLLNGDGDYRGDKAGRWRTIGRGIFQEIWLAPVAIHPGGLMWAMDGFPDESWLSIAGYQSAHADSESNSRWITTGPPATYWKRDRARALISLEAPYESPARNNQAPAADYVTRRNHYWSILNAPIVGVTYGASGIWSWSDGRSPAPGHGTRVPPAWKTVLDLPAANQMTHLIRFFESLDFQRLRPEPQVLARQPGTEDVSRFISSAQTPDRDLTVIYTPADRTISLNTAALPSTRVGEWFNPRNGARRVATGHSAGDVIEFSTPDEGDWLLVLRKTGVK